MIRPKPPSNVVRSRFEIAYLCLVILIGFGLRIPKLNTLPVSLSLDEATNGIDALRLFRAGWLTPFLQNNFGRETLFFYFQSMALQLYGISPFSLRFASALAGTITIPLMYIVGKRLELNGLVLPRSLSLNLPSLLAATGLAISYWHIYFSRVALRAILLAPLLLGLVFCFWQGWYSSLDSPRSRRGWLVAAGFLLGLCLYTYLAARLLPVLFVIFVAIELVGDRSGLKQKTVDFLVFSLASILTVIPLASYFYRNPQALSGRTQAISIFAGGAPFQPLAGNLVALLRIYFLGGTWLGQWPALNALLGIGFLIGLLRCLFRLRKPASRFLVLWWVLGTAPMIFSKQDWGATTTILRSLVGWPPLFYISAIGLTTLASSSFQWIAGLGRGPKPQKAPMSQGWIMAWLSLVLVIGGLASLRNYFSIWATTYNKRLDDNALYLAGYLNGQTDRMSLIPLSLFTDSVVNFLLQSEYPNLRHIDIYSLRSLLGADQAASPAPASAVYLWPETQNIEANLVLLDPSANGPGTAYVLPPLGDPQIEALLTHTAAITPLSSVTNAEQKPVAQVYPLVADAPFLPGEPIPWRSAQANFDNQVWLTGYHVEPAIAKPGEWVTLYLNWQIRGPIDGDYYLFLHLFDLALAQRRAQANLPFNSIIYRWSAPLAFADTYRFRLPPDSLQGVYLFEIGLYHNFSLERLPVIIGEGNQVPDDEAILGKFRVQSLPPSLPQYPINAQFGDAVSLLGGDFPERSLYPGQTLTYTLHWQAINSIALDYTVFNHVLDAQGNMIAQQDSMPQHNQYPTSWWDPGEIVTDPRSIPLPAELGPGVYTLRIGLYDPQTGQRLPLNGGGQDFVELPGFFSIEAERK
jgi:4-amino-4-deoxy-L-arabinose transferase-like glycosyltransferase